MKVMGEKFDFSKLWKNKALWLAGIGVLLLVALAGGTILTLRGGVEITALQTSGTQVEPDTTFHIQLRSTLTEEQLRAKLTLTPEIPYALAAQEDGSYILTPTRPLEAGTQLTIRCGGQSFAFSVAKTLLVTSFLPMNGSTGVPVTAGIELWFSQENLDLADFKAAISISPEASMEVVREKNKFILYPSTGLDYSTLYTVTLKAPLATPSGFALREEVTFSFTTLSKLAENTDRLFSLSSNSSLNVFPDEAPLVMVYLDEAVPRPAKLTVDVYRYGLADSYRGELERNSQQYRGGKGGWVNSFTGENTTQYATFEAEVFPAEEDDREGYSSNQFVLPFPEALPAGQYLVELSLPTGEVENGKPYVIKRQMLLQSSTLSTFFMQTGDDLLLWVNDTVTGEPVQDAAFRLTGDIAATATTGADGTALVTGPDMSVKEWGDMGVFTITAGDRVFMDSSPFEVTEKNPSLAYISYLFTDRPVYRTTDTIQVWGMVRPRSTTTPAPKELLLQLNSDEGIPVKPDARGLFTATIPLKNRTASWGNLQLLLGEDRIASGNSFLVMDYVKPVYTGTSTPTKPFFFLPGGDVPAVGLDVTLFDGTPVPGFAAEVESWSKATFHWEGAELATDEKGHLQVTATVPDTVNSWYPRSYEYRFSNKDAEAEGFNQYGSFYVIHRDLMLSGRPTVVGDKVEVTLTTNRVDTSRVKTTEELWEKDALKGAPTNTPVTARLMAIRYKKEQIGTAYDFINKVSAPRYRYKPVVTEEQLYTFTTQQGSYTLKDLPRSNEDVTYHLELSALDSSNRLVEYAIHLSPPYQLDGRGGEADNRYSLGKKREGAQMEGHQDDSGFYYDSWNQYGQFTDREAVTFQLQRNEKPVEKLTGRLLYSTVQTGIKSPTVSTDAEFTLPYSEELLPNYVLAGAYFDGKRVFYLESTYMHFDPQQRELNIQLTGDKKSYKPAEQVQLSATVTNKVTGKPAANADMVVAVVDEAVFALREQSLDLLTNIYRSVYYPNITKYSSYAPSQFGGAGEKGGGGGEDIRDDFQDTTYFATGKTDAKGQTTFRFTLPDNITSWRASALALTENNQAGGAKAQLTATKPFFVTPVVNETILLGDSFAVGLRSAGTAVTQQDAVRYTVTVEGPGGRQTHTASSPLREYAPLLFTAPAVGSYTVTVEGSCGGFTDTVRLPFIVVPAGVEATRVKSFNLAQGIQIAPLRYPVTIALYDQNTRTYNRVLQSLIGDSYGHRADMRIARKYTAQLMEERSDGWYISSKDEDIRDLLTGYMGVLPHTPKDMDLTVQLHLALPQLLDNQMLGYVSVQDTGKMTGRLSSYYLGQMLAKSMTLEELKAVIAADSKADGVDALNYAAAYAVGGDAKTAAQQYAALVTPKLQKLTGLDGEEVLYLPADGAASEGDCTAAAFRLAALLEHPDAEPLVLYLVQKKSQYQPYIAEQLLFLHRYAPKAGQTGKLSYTQNGKTETVTLNTTGKQLSMDEAQLANAKFKVLSGQVYADVYYTGAPQDTAEPAQHKLEVTKTITPMEGTIATGKLVKVTLTPNLSGLDNQIGDTELVIDDYIPSGMKFEQYGATHWSQNWQGWYLNSRQGQRLRFAAYGNNCLTPIVYYARCSAPGDYVVESAFISSASSSVWGSSTRAMVQIN